MHFQEYQTCDLKVSSYKPFILQTTSLMRIFEEVRGTVATIDWLHRSSTFHISEVVTARQIQKVKAVLNFQHTGTASF